MKKAMADRELWCIISSSEVRFMCNITVVAAEVIETAAVTIMMAALMVKTAALMVKTVALMVKTVKATATLRTAATAGAADVTDGKAAADGISEGTLACN
jgi:hypothetical protein